MKESIEIKFQDLGGLVPIGESFAPVSDVELQSIETTLRHPVPADYRTFLQQYGGSTFREYVGFQPIQSLPPPISSNGKGLFSCFYGASSERHNSLAAKIKTFRGRMPETFLPIGHDSGNQLCLGFTGKEYGKVYYWDHQNEWDAEDYLHDHGKPMPSEVKFSNVYWVAETFEDFIFRLEKWPDA